MVVSIIILLYLIIGFFVSVLLNIMDEKYTLFIDEYGNGIKFVIGFGAILWPLAIVIMIIVILINKIVKYNNYLTKKFMDMEGRKDKSCGD